MSNDFETGLYRHVGRLAAQYDQARNDWRDELAGRFERDYWHTLVDANDNMLRSLEITADDIANIERELEAIASGL